MTNMDNIYDQINKLEYIKKIKNKDYWKKNPGDIDDFIFSFENLYNYNSTK